MLSCSVFLMGTLKHPQFCKMGCLCSTSLSSEIASIFVRTQELGGLHLGNRLSTSLADGTVSKAHVPPECPAHIQFSCLSVSSASLKFKPDELCESTLRATCIYISNFFSSLAFCFYFYAHFWYFMYPCKPSVILSGMRWHINAYIYAYINVYWYLRKIYQIQMHPSRSLVFKRGGEEEGKGSYSFKKYMCQYPIWLLLTPTLRGPGNIRMWVYIYTSLPLVLYPWPGATSPCFLSSIPAFGQKAARSVRLAHLSMEMPFQSHAVAVMP